MQASQPSPAPTACMIVIGNEILSGRTQDKNLAWIAKQLAEMGIPLREARVIPDVKQVIIDTVNEMRPRYSYVFTSGGIGPTHDDITTECIAAAFGAPVERNKEAEAILTRHYGEENLNTARLKMADIPAGATLIANPVSAAPGFKLENVYVMAGVPSIMQAMFDNLKHSLTGGPTILSRSISAFVTEGMLADALAAIQNATPEIDIGSYPFMRSKGLGTTLVARGTDRAKLEAVYGQIKAMLLNLTPEIIEDEPA